jgi:hypothetical protein
VTKDYFQKPLSNVASHSRGTTLYGTRTLTAGEVRPLEPAGEAGLVGVRAHLNEVRECVGIALIPGSYRLPEAPEYNTV